MCSDTIPACITLAEALVLRERKEKEMLEDNPAMAPSFQMPSSAPTPDAEPTMSDVPKPAKRSLSTNGKEKINGSASTGIRRTSKRPTTAGDQMQTPHDEFLEMQASSSMSLPFINGHPSGISRSLTPPLAQNGSDHGAIPLQSQYPDPHSHSCSPTPPFHAQDDPAWPGQFTGPASGFLHSVAYFNRTQNPGRTIYSQSTSQRPD